MKRRPNRLYWRLCIAAMLLLTVLTFTPLVIPYGEYRPVVAGMPLTLWTSILIAFAMVLVTYIGTRVHPGHEADVEEQQ